MLRAACCLAFFAFLCAGEFMVNSAFQPSIHMTVDDLQADSLVNPTCFKVHIKCSKSHAFCMGCDINVGRAEGLVCPIRALGDFLALRGSSEGPSPSYTATVVFHRSVYLAHLLVILAPIQAIASVLGQQLRPLPVGSSGSSDQDPRPVV